MSEKVMVVPTPFFKKAGYFQGFMDTNLTADDPYLELFHNRVFLDRDHAEKDPNFKQLIPYCVFFSFDEDGDTVVFQYSRSPKGGEGRLHGLKSVGVGGHLTAEDFRHDNYWSGLERELNEEVEFDPNLAVAGFHRRTTVGLINDDSNDVGKVHLGVVHLIYLREPEMWAKEDKLQDAGFVKVAPIKKRQNDGDTLDEFETWSQICLKELF